MAKEASLFTLEGAMRSILSRVINWAFFAVAASAVNVHAHTCDIDLDQTSPKTRGDEQTSTICLLDSSGKSVEVGLVFDIRRANLYLKLSAKSQLLEKVGPKFNPTLVDTASRIRFLPPRLQLYRSQGKLLFVSSRRSVGGGGGGQCGSGSEDYLNVLDLTSSSPHVVGKFLIGSCIDGVELDDVNNFGEFKSFWLEGGALGIQFLSYDGRCEGRLAAYLDGDFRKFRFADSRAVISK